MVRKHNNYLNQMENNNLLLILGNQLFPIEYIKAVDCKKFS